MKRPTAHGLLLTAITIGIVAVAILSGILSYTTLIAWARSEYGVFAPLFAAIIDVGMVVFALATLWKVLKRQRKLGVRLATHTLAGLSILYNSMSGSTTEAMLIHATPPLILIMSVETLLGIVWRRQQEIAPQLDRIRLSRWLLAPISTASIWRRMVLWELRSYSVAMEIDRERVKSRIKMMQQAKVRFWFLVPRDKRTELKLRLLELARSHADPVPGQSKDGAVSSTVPGAVPQVPAPIRLNGSGSKPSVPDRAQNPVPTNGSKAHADGDRKPSQNRQPSASTVAVTDDDILAALDQLYDSDPRDPDRQFTSQDDIRRHFGVRKARVSAVNKLRRAVQDAKADASKA